MARAESRAQDGLPAGEQEHPGEKGLPSTAPRGLSDAEPQTLHLQFWRPFLSFALTLFSLLLRSFSIFSIRPGNLLISSVWVI